MLLKITYARFVSLIQGTVLGGMLVEISHNDYKSAFFNLCILIVLELVYRLTKED